jgi:hypothetical protein
VVSILSSNCPLTERVGTAAQHQHINAEQAAGQEAMHMWLVY